MTSPIQNPYSKNPLDISSPMDINKWSPGNTFFSSLSQSFLLPHTAMLEQQSCLGLMMPPCGQNGNCLNQTLPNFSYFCLSENHAYITKLSQKCTQTHTHTPLSSFNFLLLPSSFSEHPCLKVFLGSLSSLQD